MNEKITVKNTCIVINDYNLGDCPNLEQLFSVYDPIKHKYESFGIFYDEENNKLEFEQIALINIDESRYAILHPVDMGYQDDDAIAYEIKEENGNFELLEVEDDDLLEEIYKRFKSLVKASKRPRK